MTEFFDASIEPKLPKPVRYTPQILWKRSSEEIALYERMIVAADKLAGVITSALIQALEQVEEIGTIEAAPVSSNNKAPKNVLYGSVYGYLPQKILFVTFHTRTCSNQEKYTFLSSLINEQSIKDVLTIRCDIARGKTQVFRLNTPSVAPSSSPPPSEPTSPSLLSTQFNASIPPLPIGIVIEHLPAAITSYCDYRQIASVLLTITIDDIDLPTTGKHLNAIHAIIVKYFQEQGVEGREWVPPTALKEFQQWRHTLSSSTRHLYT
jgi:hypothetical protein